MRTYDSRAYEIVERALEGHGLPDEDICYLYGLDIHTPEAYHVMWAAQQMSMQAADGKAEVHAQIGLNGTPCPCNCKFCSFAVCNAVRHGKLEMPREDVVEYALRYEDEGANLILLLTTGSYKFEKLVEMAGAVRAAIDPKMPLLVNTADMSAEQCLELKAVGVNGAYHAVRMREGEDTGIPVEKRMQTFANLKAAGLTLSTCVEPVGPEHTAEELTQATRRCIDSVPLSGGVGRRISVPGTPMAQRGMFNYVHAAYYVAVYRLASGLAPRLNCSAHSTVVANAGGNLSWAEVGTNPRDTVARTERGGRGMGVAESQKVFRDSEWEVFEGPSPGWML
jgi:biotin synthase